MEEGKLLNKEDWSLLAGKLTTTIRSLMKTQEELSEQECFLYHDSLICLLLFSPGAQRREFVHLITLKNTV